MRYILSQVYQIEIAYAQQHGQYSADLMKLLHGYCSIEIGCNATDMTAVLTKFVNLFHLEVRVVNSATSCVKYATQMAPAAPTGGPCFNATVDFTMPESGYRLHGSIREDRYLQVNHPPGAWQGDAPCLDESAAMTKFVSV